MTEHEEAEKCVKGTDAEQYQAAKEAFSNMPRLDQLKLMLWLTKRDHTLCKTELFIMLAYNWRDLDVDTKSEKSLAEWQAEEAEFAKIGNALDKAYPWGYRSQDNEP